MKLEDGYKIKAGDRLLIEVEAVTCVPSAGGQGWVEDGYQKVAINAATFKDQSGRASLKLDQLWINRSQIKEVIPREFQVGDRVFIEEKVVELRGVIKAIYEDSCWVLGDNDVTPLTYNKVQLRHEG